MAESNVIPIRSQDADLTRLWAEYEKAAREAQFSLRIEDGIAAGQAWAAFLREFEGK